MTIYVGNVSPLPPSVRLERSPLTTEVWAKFIIAWLAISASAWLWLVDPRFWPRATALAGGLFGVLWIRRYCRTRSLEKQGARARLELSAGGLVLEEAGGERIELPWHKVCRIEQDQDALMVCVVRQDGTEMRLDPEYGGLGLHDLSQLLHRFLLQSRECTVPDKG